MPPQTKPKVIDLSQYEDYNDKNVWEDVTPPKPVDDTFMGMAGKGVGGALEFGKNILKSGFAAMNGGYDPIASQGVMDTVVGGVVQPFKELATPRRQGEGFLPDIGERIARAAVAGVGGDYEDIDKHWMGGNYGALAGDLVVPAAMAFAPKVIGNGMGLMKGKPSPMGDLPIKPPINPAITKSLDPNMNMGMGDPMLAGSEPYRATPSVTPPAPSVASPPVFILKPNQQIPKTIKALIEKGYTHEGVNPDGSMRFKKTGPPTSAPILEADVPLKAKVAGDVPPNKPPGSKGIDEGQITPPEKEPGDVKKKPSMLREAYELSRALMSIDLPFSTSAAFRQALPHVGTKNWFKAFVTSAKAYGSEASYQATMKRIGEMPMFRERPSATGGKPQPSFAKEIGLKMTDLGELTAREEANRSRWAEQIPVYGHVVRASNRAYTAFLNDLRANTFESLMKDSKIMEAGGMNNLPLSKALAEFINDTTGRSSLKFDVGYAPGKGKTINLEKGAQFLTDTLFSPRLMASRIRMLNPMTYMMAPPLVRKQYAHAMMRSIGAWWTISSLAELAGAEVSKDPNSADFGKIKIGNTRLDPGGGFQQFLVLGSRMRPDWAGIGEGTKTGIGPIDLATGLAGHGGGGITSSTSQKFTPFGQGYKPETRRSTTVEFMANKLHPTLKLAWDLGSASENRPLNLMDRTVQMYLPIIAGDITEIIREDPSLLPLVALGGTFGMGTQTYNKGIEEPSFIPDSMDIKIGGSKNSRVRR